MAKDAPDETEPAPVAKDVVFVTRTRLRQDYEDAHEITETEQSTVIDQKLIK